MKTICAWCGNTIAITCHCGAPLTVTTYIGSTFDQGAMVCFNGETVLTYSKNAIEAMPTTFGMCMPCGLLTHEELDQRLLQRRKTDPTLPDHAAALDIAAANAKAATHEGQTRAADRAAIHHSAHTKKRGPTVVPAPPTDTPPDDTKKETTK
jgi:hypothetical protein